VVLAQKKLEDVKLRKESKILGEPLVTDQTGLKVKNK